MKTLFARFFKDQSGATAIEYGLIAAIVGVGLITTLGLLKTELNATFTEVKDALSTANAAAN
jgi:pilus assembly protein Flp/PilA